MNASIQFDCFETESLVSKSDFSPCGLWDQGWKGCCLFLRSLQHRANFQNAAADTNTQIVLHLSQGRQEPIKLDKLVFVFFDKYVEINSHMFIGFWNNFFLNFKN